jgi:methyl-accepting chemotaxis protein
MARLSTVVQNIRNTSSHVAGDSQAMSASATQLSQGASMQAEAAEEASSSMEEMVANIRQNADNAKQTEQIALQSAEDAREGGIAVAKTISAMKEIAEKISIIQEIAMQTHILSMNATIEAAKAQDYGKGFAVVASEVRSLSHRSGEAAEGIEKLVRSCVSISEQAGEILQRLVPNSEKTAELVQEINAASDEQHTGAAQISTAIQRLDRVIQQNAATADQMASSAEQLAEQADQLQQAIAFFTVKEVVLPETVEANTDLGQTVQAVMAMKGIDKETRATLLKTLVASNSDEIASLQEPAEQTSPDSTRPKDASHSLTDGLDDEFERY